MSEHGAGKLAESDRMNWNSASVVSLLTGVIAMTGGGAARAETAAGCAPVAVAADASLHQRWPDLPAQIRQTFQTRADVDTCARIQLAAAGAAIELTVILPDGRTAFRAVARREDVLPALEALLLLPESDTAAGDASPPGRREPGPSPVDTTAIALAATTAPPDNRPAPFRIEIGLQAEARTGAGWVGGGVGVTSFLDLAHWLLGFEGRVDRFQVPGSAGAQSVALELIALGGHRFDIGNHRSLDLAVGPALALHGTSMMTVQMTSTGTVIAQTSNDENLPRLVASARLTFGAQSLLRTFVQLDADVGQPGSATAPRPNEDSLPAWTVGLALGATVGTR